jgi:hypothetical protein
VAIQAAAEKGGAALRGKDLGPEWAEHCRQRSRKLNMTQHFPDTRAWTPQETALLGTLPDKDLGAKIGKTRAAVQRKRSKMGIPPCT